MFPDDFIDHTRNISCANDSESFLGSFPYPNNSLVDKLKAQSQCKKFCGANKRCWGCNLHCGSTCQWIARAYCNGRVKPDTPIKMEISTKPSKWRYYLLNDL